MIFCPMNSTRTAASSRRTVPGQNAMSTAIPGWQRGTSPSCSSRGCFCCRPSCSRSRRRPRHTAGAQTLGLDAVQSALLGPRRYPLQLVRPPQAPLARRRQKGDQGRVVGRPCAARAARVPHFLRARRGAARGRDAVHGRGDDAPTGNGARWEEHEGVTVVLAGTGVDPAPFGPSYRLRRGLGVFGTREEQRAYVLKYMPPAVAGSAAGRLLVRRMWTWLRGRCVLGCGLYLGEIES
ncbi:hypothetical protein BD626DRAFT_192283 [Schizophyllum amplum]|uniref:Uncharacterized protein n=1 Tax=Schizophyllum amplum TaxID=97359 RepID=A0A550CM10_9AGAR|nr:hypothetical protein BD626DRAFT_192283 [Auriculariopsis ampla]